MFREILKMRETCKLPFELGSENVPRYLNLDRKAIESIASPHFLERQQSLRQDCYTPRPPKALGIR